MSSPRIPSAEEALTPLLATAVPRPSGAPPAIPDYELLRGIGAGSYGEVWLARSTTTGALRAVKLVYRATFTDERPFRREFEGIQKFEALSRAHPSQLALFHVGRIDSAGCFYYVMELADPVGVSDPCAVISNQRSVASNQSPAASPGSPLNTDSLTTDYSPRTLRSDLEAGRLSAASVLELGLALTEALAHLHAHGLVHRDIKPSNIIYAQGRPKLADIGLVTDASSGDGRSIVGTEGYLPPEGPGTPTADLFALSRVLYEALTGLDRRRFPELPSDLREWPDAALAFELNTILVRGGASDERQRYASADAMRADLELIGAGKSVKRRQAWRRAKRTGAFTLLAAGVFAAGLLWHSSRPPADTVKAAPQIGWTTNKEAATAVEKAIYLHGSGRPESYPTARRYLEEAIRLDSGFAYAHACLALNDVEEAYTGQREALDALVAAEIHVRHALQLEPNLAFAHTVLGDVLVTRDYAWVEGEAQFRRAQQLDASSDNPQVMLANRVLTPQGRLDEAVQVYTSALERDPSSPRLRTGYSQTLYHTENYTKALSEIDQVLELQPNLRWGRRLRADILLALGQSGEAVDIFQKLVAEAPEVDWLQAALFHAQTVAGRAALGGPTLGQLLDRKDKPRAAYGLALAYTALNDATNALTWLETAYVRRDPALLWLKLDPRFDSLRGEERFQQLLKKMNLVP